MVVKDILLFPGKVREIVITEPRYTEMVMTALNGDRRFGLVSLVSSACLGVVVEILEFQA
jgi:Lon protease-like protein